MRAVRIPAPKRVRLVAVATLLALGVTAAAPAATPIEDRLAPIVSSLAGRPAGVHCWSTQANWDAFRAQSGVPPDADAFVIPGGSTIDMSPGLCATLQAFAASPPGARCRTGTKRVTTSRSVWRWRTVTVRGAKRRIRVRVKVTRAVLLPVFGVCTTPRAQIDALWTVAREAARLGGRDEAAAACEGLRNVETVALGLGAAPAAAALAARQAAASSTIPACVPTP